ncbi:MAG: hydrogenase maturation nickel metallochaperone HypA [Chloroflexaceae bacterium]|nr:hydrogenase maturation nickel metallochaperone HypA [Chloroflexaceae bacterium]NJL35150.1 hydrogenase maturation nickel metallochaperone HypA [Chloroflexaceae bacterium]NJO04917.1 hydrogenase maturation nickel metallochaperone HypA [Chloroflexaceae bacterium]
MHELPVTQGILSVAIEAAEQAGGRRIVAIDLVIGTLSSIVDDSVQFYFDILSRGTLADGAVLRFRREPAILVCWDCDYRTQVVAPLPALCSACGSTRLILRDGQEFFVEAIEIEEPPPEESNNESSSRQGNSGEQ